MAPATCLAEQVVARIRKTYGVSIKYRAAGRRMKAGSDEPDAALFGLLASPDKGADFILKVIIWMVE